MDAKASWTTTYVILLYNFCVLLRPVHFWLPLFRPVFFVARFPPVAAVRNPPGGMKCSEKPRQRHADGGDREVRTTADWPANSPLKNARYGRRACKMRAFWPVSVGRLLSRGETDTFFIRLLGRGEGSWGGLPALPPMTDALQIEDARRHLRFPRLDGGTGKEQAWAE